MKLTKDEKVAIINAKTANGRSPMAMSFVIKTKNSYRVTQRLPEGTEYLFKVWYDNGNYVENSEGKEIERPRKSKKSTSNMSDTSNAEVDRRDKQPG